MVELVDSVDLGSTAKSVQVRVLLPAPEPDTRFDTMRIKAGVRLLFAEAPVCKGFSIPFNESRLCGNRKMVTVEPLAFSPTT